MPVHGLDLLTSQALARDIRLVRGNDEPEPMVAQPAQCFGSTGDDNHFLDCVGGIGLAVPDVGLIQHAITVEEDGPRHTVATAFSTPSHLVCLAFKAGCVTSRCQITA